MTVPAALDVLAVGAHPDDVELSAGGTVCLLTDGGYRVGILDLTRGELGSRGTPETRRAEADEAARILGLTTRDNLGLEDAGIVNSVESRLKFIRVIRRYRPHVVFTHPLECRHPDHTAAARLTVNGCFYSGLRKIETYDTGGRVQEPWRPHHVLHYAEVLHFEPTFVVDVSDTWERRIRAMQAYRTQFFHAEYRGEPDTFVSNPEFFAWIEARARTCGYPIGAAYGEAFSYRGTLGVRDLMGLLGSRKAFR